MFWYFQIYFLLITFKIVSLYFNNQKECLIKWITQIIIVKPYIIIIIIIIIIMSSSSINYNNNDCYYLNISICDIP